MRIADLVQASVLEYLGRRAGRSAGGLPDNTRGRGGSGRPVLDRAMAVLIYMYSGQSSKFIYINF